MGKRFNHPSRKSGRQQSSAHRSSQSKRQGTYRQSRELSILNGSFFLHPDGFGFVKPDRSTGGDIFIPPSATFGALTLDYVQIQAQFYGNQKSSGKIIKILKRRSDQIVGSVSCEDRAWLISERKSKKTFALKIPKKARIAAGDIAIATLDTNHGTTTAFLNRRIDPDCFDDCRSALLAEFGLSDRFPQAVEQEMAQMKPGDSDAFDFPMQKRVDLTSKAIVTIDGPDAKDFDDAVYAERSKGGYRLWVSIADVSAYVKKGSACDEEAFARGTSTYFPGFALPMLPELLSNGLCSLVPHQPRLTFTAEIDLDAQGNPTQSRLYPSLIRSQARLTYGDVQAFFDGKPSPKIDAHRAIAASLTLLQEIAMKLIERRRSRGSLDFDLPEAVFVLDKERATILDIKISERLFSHRLIEELMILANEEVGQFMERHALPGLWRVHDSPDPEALEHFLMSLKTYSQVVIAAAETGKKQHRSKEARTEQRVIAPKQLQGWIQTLKGKSYEPFMMKLLLRSLKQACYEEQNIGHFGLASQSYAHFTSPIRRYPDLFVHRLLRRFLINRSQKFAAPKIPVGAFASHRERISMEAEREMNKLYSAHFMRDKVGKEFSGKISHTTPNGFFVLLDEFYAEGFVSADELDAAACYDTQHLAWADPSGKRCELGQSVRVQVLSVSLYDRIARFSLLTI